MATEKYQQFPSQVDPAPLPLRRLSAHTPETETHEEFTDDPLALYLRDIAKIPLLTSQREKELFEIFSNQRPTATIELLGKKQEELRKIKTELKIVGLPHDRHILLAHERHIRKEIQSTHAELAKTESGRALDEIVTANLRLVVAIAKHYLHRGLALEDLIEEGNIGLMRGVERFDVNKGYKLSTYASWWIKQGIRRALQEKGSTIRLPSYQYDLHKKILKVTDRLTQEKGYIPSPEDVAAELTIDVETLLTLVASQDQIFALDGPASNDADSSDLIETIEDTSIVPPEEEAAIAIESQELQKALARNLSKREQETIALLYGLKDGRQYTRLEVAKQLSLSRERIRQLEMSALAKLRNNPRVARKLQG